MAIERKLAAIMFTDIVGYSSMMSKDESHSLKLLEEHNRIIKSVIDKYSGKIIKYIGDSIFSIFDNPAEAVKSAVEFQYKLKNRNRLAKRRDRIPLRVGIHHGRVIAKDNDLFGNAVNITSRIEGVASIGGIAVSSELVDAIDSIDTIFIRKMGTIKLKNIPMPKIIYKVYLNQVEWQSENDESLLNENLKRGINMVDIDNYQVLNTFSLAMHDTQIESDNSEDINYAEYLTEDIISDFQRINDIRVPLKNEIRDAITQDLSKPQIALKLKVNNILENKINFSGDNMFFSSRLFSNISGEYVWENSWNCKRENTSYIRYNLMTDICNYFDITLPEKLQNTLSKQMTDNSIAMKKYIDGRSLLEKLSDKSVLQQSCKLFEEATLIDNNFIEAHAKHAFVSMKLGYYDKCEEILDNAMEIADDTDNDRGKIEIFNYLGNLFGVQHKLTKAKKNTEKALKMLQLYDDQSSESRFLYNLAGHMYYARKPEEALTYLDRSRELKVNLEENESLTMVYALYGNVYTILNDHSKAIDYRERSVAQSKEMGMELLVCKYLVALAGSYQKIGDYDRAKDILLEANDMDAQTFDEGKIYLIRARIYIDTDEYNAALQELKSAEQIFHKRGDNRMLANTYMEFATLNIYLDMLEQASHYIDLVMEYLGKVRDNDFQYLPQCISLYTKPEINENDIEKLEEYLNKIVEQPRNYIQWYFLALAYEKANNSKKASNCREIAQISLKKLSECNSYHQHRESMLSNIPLHRKILN